jgi:hypothetical protein
LIKAHEKSFTQSNQDKILEDSRKARKKISCSPLRIWLIFQRARDFLILIKENERFLSSDYT